MVFNRSVLAAVNQSPLSAVKNSAVLSRKSGFNDEAAQIQVIKDGKFRHFATIDDPVLLAPPTK